MSHVQRTRHVGRRDQYAVTIPRDAGFEKSLFFPVRVEALFDSFRIKSVVHVDSDNA